MTKLSVAEEAQKKADDIIQALSKRYPSPAWAFFPQVRNGTGFTKMQVRTADAVAMGLWPSRGMELYGFEIKVHRADWLRELRDTAKADEIFQYCDRWWLVAGNESIVHKGELPATWGLMVLHGTTQIRVETEAPRLDAVPPDRVFLAAVLRKASEVITPASRLNAEFQKGLADGRKDRQNDLSHELQDARGEVKQLKKRIDDFHEASGVHIDQWDGERIGDAVRQVLHGPQWEGRLRNIRDIAQGIIKDIDTIAQSKPEATREEVDGTV